MKIKELINYLEKILEEKGNIPVQIVESGENDEGDEYFISYEIDYVTSGSEKEALIWKGDEI